MNPLVKYPNMFANGHFSARASFKDPEIPKKDWYEDEGLITSSDIYGRISIGGADLVRGDYCLLIARKKTDMTPEEEYEYRSILKRHEFSSNFSEIRRDAFDAHLYLLSIGVYPFDQTHFDKGWVITEGRTITRQWWKEQLEEIEAMAENHRRLYKETGEQQLALLKQSIHYEEVADFIYNKLYD